MKSKFTIYFCIAICLFSCKKEPEIWKFGYGTIPTSPVNMEEFNSEYDDYNSTFPTVGNIFPICFSSNRNSNGVDYDIVYKLTCFEFSLINGDITVDEFKETTRVYNENYTLNNALPKINTSSNELGPYLIDTGELNGNTYNSNFKYNAYIFMYSNDKNGNQDIHYLHNLDSDEFNQPNQVTYLNSPYDDAYPTINKDSSAIYFCSNREGNFDIFYADLTTENTLLGNLENTTEKPILKDTALSSDFDDKCPFIIWNTLIFTSNRPGGFGGFDLYYSKFEDGSWTEPVNFGSEINTSYDEYRPIIKSMWEANFSNDLMIFSSNRPGGKGGFDLYYVGVEQIYEPQ